MPDYYNIDFINPIKITNPFTLQRLIYYNHHLTTCHKVQNT